MSAIESYSTDPTAAAGLAVRLARLADELNCSDVLILNVAGISPVTDYFVIATGTSARQLRSVADQLAESAADADQRLFSMEGRRTGNWILLDFIDVVAHLFDEPARRHYDLDLLWGDAPRLDWAETK